MKVAVVGCGAIGERHVRACAKVDGMVVRAVCDTDTARAERLAGLYQSLRPDAEPVAVVGDYADLLANGTVDVVALAVPSGLHAKTAIQALQAGKHVVLEKPMALSTRDAQALMALAARGEPRLVVCHQKRFYPHLRQIRKLMEDGCLGRMVAGSLSLVYHRDDAYYQASPWRGTWEMDGGVLLNQAIHDIDLLLWLAGEPVRVAGWMARLDRPMEAEDTALLSIQTADGALLSVTASVCGPPGTAVEELTITGTRGGFRLTGKALHPAGWWVDAPVPQVLEIDPHAAVYQDLVQAVAADRAPWVGAKEAWPALHVIFGAYASWLKGEWVTLPADGSTFDLKRRVRWQGGNGHG
ncbi:oxidoreductase [Alicyclobacillus cellulosilyticus]|uniref:Oxidoreductase n=1 Tax=Alicyclobacillus cellulosilyticus TaxID=1003997 RepID=A0A917KC96_9BACL|nr:Gfo/Idh/MocA family oxidoreductase [Alicyclobacillus cellulosilyticus]GGJ06511.1 oxidoreductase [Alicyclobacillus cellulosilyticus]